jgi:hypothetical protein
MRVADRRREDAAPGALWNRDRIAVADEVTVEAVDVLADPPRVALSV